MRQSHSINACPTAGRRLGNTGGAPLPSCNGANEIGTSSVAPPDRRRIPDQRTAASPAPTPLTDNATRVTAPAPTTSRRTGLPGRINCVDRFSPTDRHASAASPARSVASASMVTGSLAPCTGTVIPASSPRSRLARMVRVGSMTANCGPRSPATSRNPQTDILATGAGEPARVASAGPNLGGAASTTAPQWVAIVADKTASSRVRMNRPMGSSPQDRGPRCDESIRGGLSRFRPTKAGCPLGRCRRA